ncbi:MAG TPA: glycosyltransferase family 9 protein [Alphaproteobacteria bacterium]
MRSILIVRAGAVGDAVLTLPLLEALAEAGVERIGVLGTPGSWAFLAPGGVELFDFDGREWLGLFTGETSLGPRAERLAREFDAAIVLLGPQRERVETALRALGVAAIVGATPAAKDERASEAAVEAAFAEPHWPPGPAHAASRLLQSLGPLGATASRPAWPAAPKVLQESPFLRVEPHEVEGIVRTLAIAPFAPQGILAIHPGSGGAAKRWPAVRFASLAIAAEDRWGLTPIFVAGPADAEVWRQVQEALPQSFRPRALRERPLREVLALLSVARAYIGNDAGVGHLAARACPTLTLFGPTDPAIWHPVGRHVATLEGPRGRLKDLSLESVLEALALVWRIRNSPHLGAGP